MRQFKFGFIISSCLKYGPAIAFHRFLLRYRSCTRLGGCTGDSRSCANVPSMRGPRPILDVVLPLFGSQLLCNNVKNSLGARLMGVAGQKWPFPPTAYMGVRTSARPKFCV